MLLGGERKSSRKESPVKAIAALLVVCALLVAGIPHFNNCQHQGKALALANGAQAPMKCYWTARGEIALALPLLGVGMALAASRRREAQRALAAVGALLGLAVIALPTLLIGTCAMAGAACNLVMKPSLILFGGLVAAASLAAFALAPAGRGAAGRLQPGSPAEP